MDINFIYSVTCVKISDRDQKKKRNLETISKLFPVLTVASETKEMEFCFLDNIVSQRITKVDSWQSDRLICNFVNYL